uniref:TIR domain-containing protein n=1 Tax=Candidatus Kentrum sp. DK TaxID=2126562 RepID=A0A450T3J3_9GAMM|nr:MAG: TIR domain-containing protein [Candidatus Kentron sp. DK]
MPKLFISYSHSDHGVARRVESYFQKIGFEVLRDESILSPGDSIAETLIDNLLKSDGCILLLSKESLESSWVDYEVNNSLVQLLSKNRSYQIFPLIIEKGIAPTNFPSLSSFMWGNLTVPSEDEVWFGKIANSCLKKLNLKKIPSKKLNAAAAELARNNEYDRITRIFRSAYMKDIDELKKSTEMINEAILSQNHILTPNMIAFKESHVEYEIYVMTKHLRNDTDESEIRDSVTKNLKKGIRYTYFVFNKDIVMRNLKKYLEHHVGKMGCSEDNFNFYILPEYQVMTSSEVVIYDPMDPDNRWGYFQVRYGKASDINSIDLFYEISDNDIDEIVTGIRSGLSSGAYAKFDTRKITYKRQTG